MTLETAAAPAIRWPSRRWASFTRPPVLLLLLGLGIAAISLMPVGYLLLREGFSLQRLQHELDNPSTVPLLMNTVKLTLGVSLVCALLGTALAVLDVRTDLPLGRAWTVLFILPLGVPAFVSSYTWVAASLRYFPDSTFISTYPGVVLILSVALYPYVFLPVVAALRGVDPAQEEAGRAAGRGGLYVFLRITLPQLRLPILGGALLVGLHLLAEYGAFAMLRFETFTTAIVQRATVLGAPEAARALAVVLAAGSVLLLASERLLRGSIHPTRVGSGVARVPMSWRLGWLRPLCILAALLLVLIALGVPLFVSAAGLTGLASGDGGGVDWTALSSATINTARFAVAAALAATALALPVSLLAVRYPGPLSVFIERAVWVAHSLPGIIMALALVYLGVHWLYPLYQSTTMLVIDYVILYLPLAVAAQVVGINHASPQYEEVSRSLGRRPVPTFFHVTLPIALPAIATGALLVLLNVGKELTTTLLLHPTGQDTLATELWKTTNGEVLDFTSAAPYGIALILVGAVPAYLLARQTLRTLR